MSLDVMENLSMEHVPVTLMRKRHTFQKQDGSWGVNFSFWCAFFDAVTSELKVCYNGLGGGGDSSAINGLRLTSKCNFRTDSESALVEHREITEDRTEDGYESVEGRWFIQPETSRLFNLDDFSDRVVSNLNIRDVGLNGFNTPDPAAIEQSRIELNRRLQGITSKGGDWFF